MSNEDEKKTERDDGPSLWTVAGVTVASLVVANMVTDYLREARIRRRIEAWRALEEGE